MTSPRLEESVPQLELNEHIKNLQSDFLEAWKKYPELTFIAAKFFGNNELNPNLETLRDNFLTYQTKKAITDDFKDDFNRIISSWKKLRGEVKNDSFYIGYYLVLLMMEAHFLDALAQQLTISSKEFPEELKDEPIDVEETATRAVSTYKNILENNIYSKAADLKNQLSRETEALNEKIKAFNDQCKKLEEDVPPFDTKSVPDKINQLLKEEQTYLDHLSQLEKLQRERVDLSSVRDEQVRAQVALIDQHIATSRLAAQLIEPNVDFSTLAKFQVKEKIINRLEFEIDAILRKNYGTSEQLILRKNLKNKLDKFKKELSKYFDNHQGFFVPSKEAANLTHYNLNASYRFLNDSPLFEKDAKNEDLICTELSAVVLEKENKKNELEKLKKEVLTKFYDKISRGGQVKMTEEIYESLRADFASRRKVSDIASTPTEAIARRRDNLDREWSTLLMTTDALPLVEQELRREQINPTTHRFISFQVEKYKENLSKTKVKEIPQDVIVEVRPEAKQELPPVVEEILPPLSLIDESNQEQSPPLPLSFDLPQNKEFQFPLERVSRFDQFLGMMKAFFRSIKEFFSKCFSCFNCFKSSQQALDEDLQTNILTNASTPLEPNPISVPGSTTGFPFPITAHEKNSDPLPLFPREESVYGQGIPSIQISKTPR